MLVLMTYPDSRVICGRTPTAVVLSGRSVLCLTVRQSEEGLSSSLLFLRHVVTSVPPAKESLPFVSLYSSPGSVFSSTTGTDGRGDTWRLLMESQEGFAQPAHFLVIAAITQH